VPSPKPVASIRRLPSEPAPVETERFIAKGMDVQTSGRLGVQTSVQTPDAPGVVRRLDGRVRRRMTVYLPPDLAQKLQVSAVTNGREVSDLVTEAVERLLASD
jgi:hypothetical protein